MTGAEHCAVDLGEGVGAAFLTRHRGVSAAPYGSLNLGLHVGDSRDHVVANRILAARALGLAADRVAWAGQVHGAGVAVVTESHAGRGATSADDALPGVDAMVTTSTVPLAMLVADCVPVLLARGDASGVAAVHAGRRGLLAGVLSAAADALRSDRSRLLAVVGPHIGACCYEVGDDVHADAVSAEPALDARTTAGRPALDLAAGVRAALHRAGVTVTAEVGECTACGPDRWFSYRRDGVTGRTAGVVWRQ